MTAAHTNCVFNNMETMLTTIEYNIILDTFLWSIKRNDMQSSETDRRDNDNLSVLCAAAGDDGQNRISAF